MRAFRCTGRAADWRRAASLRPAGRDDLFSSEDRPNGDRYVIFATRSVHSLEADFGLLVTLTMRRAVRVQPHFCGTSAQAILKNLGWRFCSMAKLVFGMNQSLDGYVDHLEFRPRPALFRHFIEQVRDLTGSVYGRRMDEVMRPRQLDRWSQGGAAAGGRRRMACRDQARRDGRRVD